MINQVIRQKSLVVFLIIAFAVAWALFLLPLAFGAPGSPTRQTVTLISWSIAMWAPGIAALIAVKLVEKKPVSSLNLKRLGNWRTYLWAWLVPIFLTIAAGVLTWIFGVGKLDLEFKAIQTAMASTSGSQLTPLMIIGIQLLAALTVGPLFNTLFALGEELGWRGFLLPRLLPLGQWKAIGLSGIVWGIWHAPVILQGHNYPQHPIAGVFLMIVFCVLFGTILSWLYLRTRSPWAPALGHGSFNAVAGLPILFMPVVDLAFGGTLSSIIGWIPMIIFIGWLVWSGRLPVRDELSVEDNPAANPEATLTL